jgi:hypothetical protein
MCLSNIAKNRTEGRPIIYMDGTYIRGSHSVPLPFGWSDDSISGLYSPVSEVQRRILTVTGVSFLTHTSILNTVELQEIITVTWIRQSLRSG